MISILLIYCRVKWWCQRARATHNYLHTLDNSDMRINYTSSEIPRVNAPQNMYLNAEMILRRLHTWRDGWNRAKRRVREYVCVCVGGEGCVRMILLHTAYRYTDVAVSSYCWREKIRLEFLPSVQAYWISCFSRSHPERDQRQISK